MSTMNLYLDPAFRPTAATNFTKSVVSFAPSTTTGRCTIAARSPRFDHASTRRSGWRRDADHEH